MAHHTADVCLDNTNSDHQGITSATSVGWSAPPALERQTCIKPPAHSSDTVNGAFRGVKKHSVWEALRIRMTLFERRQHLPGVAARTLEPVFSSVPLGAVQLSPAD